LAEVVYLVRVEADQVIVLTRAHRWRSLHINTAEYHFKAAVLGEIR
jgi:hypothetical protein